MTKESEINMNGIQVNKLLKEEKKNKKKATNCLALNYFNCKVSIFFYIQKKALKMMKRLK